MSKLGQYRWYFDTNIAVAVSMAVLTRNGPRWSWSYAGEMTRTAASGTDGDGGVWHASGEGNLIDQCYQMALCKRVIFPPHVKAGGCTQARHHACQSKQSWLCSELQLCRC